MIRVRRQKRPDRHDVPCPDVHDLTDQHRSISSQIRDLEDYIAAAPSRAAALELDRLETIPPPDFYESKVNHIHPVSALTEAPRLSRGQHAALIAERRKNMAVFFISALLLAVFVHWLANTL